MSLWQARKIAFVQQANNIRHMSPTKTKSRGRITTLIARLFLLAVFSVPCSLTIFKWINDCVLLLLLLHFMGRNLPSFDNIHKSPPQNVFLAYTFYDFPLSSPLVHNNKKSQINFKNIKNDIYGFFQAFFVLFFNFFSNKNEQLCS